MFHYNRRLSLDVVLFVLVGILGACGGSPEELSVLDQSKASLEEPSGQGMIVYSQWLSMDESSLSPMGSPEELGGEVLEGQPILSARVDFQERGMTAGIFKATTGKVRIHFPFTEHATILEGEVTLTDEMNQTRTLKQGDSYFIRKGQIIVWDVKGKHVIKSFFNITR